jgi:OmpA-OmpF porin, OOP family
MTKRSFGSWQAIVAAIALMAAASAQAQGYAGINVGGSRINVDCAGLTSCDKSDTGFKLYGGYDFGGGLAGEVVYFGWGKVKATGDFGGGLTGSGSLKADGFGAGVAYFFPVSPDWMPVVRAGIVRNTGKIDISTTLGSASDKQNSTTGYFGLGIGYKISPNLFVTGEWDFSRVKYDIEKADTNLLSLGLRFKF